MSIKGQGHSLTLVKGHSDFKVKTCFSQKQLGDLEPTFIWKLEGEWEWKFIQMSWVTWPTWPPCPYMVKTLKSFFPEPIDWWPWNLVCSIVYASTTKVFQIMTLGWPWPIVRQGQIWLHMLLYGRKWKFIYLFGNYSSLRSQSCLKHSAKWVNEVEWVSKVKAILWSLSKITQISKLNVWFWPVYSGKRFRASWPSCFDLSDGMENCKMSGKNQGKVRKFWVEL